MVRVRFVRDDTPFRRGDEKDCSPAEAEKFIRQGVAEGVDEEPKATRRRKARKTKRGTRPE